MKEAVFDPAWYVDEHYADLERRHLFEQLWLAAGFRSMLKKEGDYFTWSVCGHQVVIHLLDGQVRAYLNMCPHRGGPIVVGLSGNARPVCHYHGWSFRNAAALTGMSMAEAFEHHPELKQERCGRGLQTVAVRIVGPVIFVNLAADPLPIEAQFSGEVLALLADAGGTSSVIQVDFQANFNWKLNFENVKDYMHVLFVHPSTFLGVLPDSSQQVAGDRPVVIRESSLARYPPYQPRGTTLQGLSYSSRANYDGAGLWCDPYLRRHFLPDSYVNIYLFPNTNFTAIGGRYFGMQQYLPTAAQCFDYRLTIGLAEMTRNFDATPLLLEIARAERYVIEEDTVILEKVQRNFASLRGRPWRFTQGDYEVSLMEQMCYLRDHVYAAT